MQNSPTTQPITWVRLWGDFDKQDYGPPWGGPIFSRGGIIDIMFQNIYVGGDSPEAAWQEAVGLMQTAQEEWLADHPDWEAPSP